MQSVPLSAYYWYNERVDCLSLMTSNHSKLLEFIGALTGVAGAILLALNIPESGYGFLFFLVSSTALSIFAVQEKLRYLLMMQVVFTVINAVGVYRWLL